MRFTKDLALGGIWIAVVGLGFATFGLLLQEFPAALFASG